MNRATLAFVAALTLAATVSAAFVHGSEPPRGLKSEHNLPDRYPFVVKDILRYCQPKKGFWIDLGAGKGQVAIPLIEATGNPVVMLDPNAEAMSKGLEIARKKDLEHRLFAVVGVAEKMPFPDNCVDLVVSRGAIFFFDDPVKGLREVYRVLRPGGKAYIGGGAGSGYPKEAARKLIEGRKQKMQGEEAEKWKRFVELRRPEQMRKWAEDAGLPEFEVMGKGALSAEDQRVGQGVWLLFEKQPGVVTKKSEDKTAIQVKGDTATYTITSPSGIGGAIIIPPKSWLTKNEGSGGRFCS
jgi:SAM-dependent methyltransferase